VTGKGREERGGGEGGFCPAPLDSPADAGRKLKREGKEEKKKAALARHPAPGEREKGRRGEKKGRKVCLVEDQTTPSRRGERKEGFGCGFLTNLNSARKTKKGKKKGATPYPLLSARRLQRGRKERRGRKRGGGGRELCFLGPAFLTSFRPTGGPRGGERKKKKNPISSADTTKKEEEKEGGRGKRTVSSFFRCLSLRAPRRSGKEGGEEGEEGEGGLLPNVLHADRLEGEGEERGGKGRKAERSYSLPLAGEKRKKKIKRSMKIGKHVYIYLRLFRLLPTLVA